MAILINRIPTQEERGQICEHCRWFKRSGISTIGLCRVNAPTHNVPSFPIINTTDWCGRWQEGSGYRMTSEGKKLDEAEQAAIKTALSLGTP